MTRILVVEDDPDIRSMLERGLTAEGFTVSAAERASEALADARETTPAAIVRAFFPAYGCCGVTDPITELAALGLLEEHA